MKRLYNWLGKHVHAPYGTYLFILLFFIEGFFIVPVSTILTFYCLADQKRSFMYGVIATCMSGVAALAGYSIGAALWSATGTETLTYFISVEKFQAVKQWYEDYQAAAVLFATITPMPFKAVTITAGFCHVSLAPFVLFCMVGRGIKFLGISTGVYFWGDNVKYYIDKYFYPLMIIGILSFIALLWVVH